MRFRNSSTFYLLLEGIASFAMGLALTFNLVYQVETIKLNPLQLVLVGTILETATFIFEVPTGVIADVYSRRLSIIIGFVLIGLGFILEAMIPQFWTLLISQAIWGIGYTFISGAEEAWLADEVGPEQASKLYLRGVQIGEFCTLLAIGVSIALASIRINIPILAGGVLEILLAVFLIFKMPETGFVPTPGEERTSWKKLGATLTGGLRTIRSRPILMMIVGITAFAGMSSEGFDRLWTKHFVDNFHFPTIGHLSPLVWFGIINVGLLIIGIISTEIVRRKLDTSQHHIAAWSLLAIDSIKMAGIIIFALAGNFSLALASYWSIALMRTLGNPIHTAWLNQKLDSKVRATVNSLVNQADAFGQIAGGPLVGLIATVISLRISLLVTALALAPASVLYVIAARWKQL